MTLNLKKQLSFILIGMGLVLIVLSIGTMMTSYAQDNGDVEPEYIGARECLSCHRNLRDHQNSPHALALQANSDEAEVILADFSQESELLQIQFSDEIEPRTLTPDDVAFAMGSGRYVQRYVYETPTGGYRVLPIEWNTVDQQWQAFGDAESWLDDANDWTTNCGGCHVTGLDVTQNSWLDDGVQCEACHGPGSVHVELADEAGTRPSDSEMQAITGAIQRGTDPQICGQCHSQGTSITNGLPFPTNYRPGMDLLTDGQFSLVDHNDSAHWWASGHAKQTNMQFNEWVVSAHANALTDLQASPDADDSCLSCHSADAWLNDYREVPLDPATLETATEGVACVTCHNPHSEAEFDFFLRDEPDALCEACHSNGNLESIHHPTVEFYNGEPLIPEIDAVTTIHTTVENGPVCLTCHMPSQPIEGGVLHTSHNLQPALPGLADDEQPDTCTICHSDLGRNFAQQFIDGTQEDTQARLDLIIGSLENHPDIDEWVLSAISAVEGEGSFGVHNFPYTESMLNAVEEELNLAPEGTPLTPIAATDPTECLECHTDEHTLWADSAHANASVNENFRNVFAEENQPSYCFSCHASGYDPSTGTYQYEGVVCSSCHTTVGEASHPPGPVSTASDEQVCATCHSGAHAPTYDEWLGSDHSEAGIDCVDCHLSHNNGLREIDVNTTCGDCHQEALVDEVHMGQDMECTDCHMTLVTNGNSHVTEHVNHSLDIDPSVCAECHGNTHVLSVVDNRASPEELTEISNLKGDVAELEDAADENLYSGIIGGAIAALLLIGLLYVVIRVGRMR
jgi:predicted CXXCH cytochrome family protein